MPHDSNVFKSVCAIYYKSVQDFDYTAEHAQRNATVYTFAKGIDSFAAALKRPWNAKQCRVCSARICEKPYLRALSILEVKPDVMRCKGFMVLLQGCI